jgi:hypothetical protein
MNMLIVLMHSLFAERRITAWRHPLDDFVRFQFYDCEEWITGARYVEFGTEMVKHTYVLCMTFCMRVNKYKHVKCKKCMKLGQRKNEHRQEEILNEAPDYLLSPTQNNGEWWKENTDGVNKREWRKIGQEKLWPGKFIDECRIFF